jgi:hypothetical protein
VSGGVGGKFLNWHGGGVLGVVTVGEVSKPARGSPRAVRRRDAIVPSGEGERRRLNLAALEGTGIEKWDRELRFTKLRVILGIEWKES